ncbi:MAG: hypothetical protein ACK56I_08605, partial [bacterium]
ELCASGAELRVSNEGAGAEFRVSDELDRAGSAGCLLGGGEGERSLKEGVADYNFFAQHRGGVKLKSIFGSVASLHTRVASLHTRATSDAF